MKNLWLVGFLLASSQAFAVARTFDREACVTSAKSGQISTLRPRRYRPTATVGGVPTLIEQTPAIGPIDPDAGHIDQNYQLVLTEGSLTSFSQLTYEDSVYSMVVVVKEISDSAKDKLGYTVGQSLVFNCKGFQGPAPLPF